jgi:hypothetical protein
LRRRKSIEPVDTGPSAVDVELARQWVAAGYFVKLHNYSKPFPDRALEAEAQELATRIHRMAELF